MNQIPNSPTLLFHWIAVEIVGLEDELAGLVRGEVERQLEQRPVGWLDVRGAAVYLSLTPKAVRDAVAKAALPVHRTPTGRLRFRPSELDEWVTQGTR